MNSSPPRTATTTTSWTAPNGEPPASDPYRPTRQRGGRLRAPRLAALVARDDTVAAAWTGHLPNGSDVRGLSLYRVVEGRVTEARHALIDPLPA